MLADKTGTTTDIPTKNAEFVSAKNYWAAATSGRYSLVAAGSLTAKSAAKSTDDFIKMSQTIGTELNVAGTPNQTIIAYVPMDLLRRPDGTYSAYGASWPMGNGSSLILMPRPSVYSTAVIAHEFGHSFNLDHSDALVCKTPGIDSIVKSTGAANTSCTVQEYGDGGALMGVSNVSSPLTNALDYWTGFLGTGSEVYDAGTVTEPRIYTLSAWESTEPLRAVRFRDTNGQVYGLELRAALGSDSTFYSQGNAGVKITKPNPTHPGVASLIIPPPGSSQTRVTWDSKVTWAPGQVFTTTAGTRVSVVSSTGGSAVVTVTPAATSVQPMRGDIVSVGGDSLNRYFSSGGYLRSLVRLGAGWSGVKNVGLIDWNQDGYLDVVSTWVNGVLGVSYGSATGIGALQIAGTGTWSTALSLPVTLTRGAGPGMLRRDANGVLTVQLAAGWSRQLGTGWGGFSDLQVIDFDQDGSPDIIAKNAAGELKLYRLGPTGWFVNEPRRTVGTGWQSYSVLSSDRNGIIARNNGTGKLYRYGFAKGVFTGRVEIGTGWQGQNVARMDGR
jgi:hypothetical protein